MNKTLKHILLKIAHLPQNDQTWVLAQLTPTQREQLNQHQGSLLLKQAQRFSSITVPTLPPQEPLPFLCSTLKEMPSRFIAVILSEGRFPWQQQFLATSDKRQKIEEMLTHEVTQIKPAVRSLLFTTWHNHSHFSHHLDDHNG